MPPLPLADSENVSGRIEELFQVIETDLTTRLGLPVEDAKEMLESVIDPSEQKGDSK